MRSLFGRTPKLYHAECGSRPFGIGHGTGWRSPRRSTLRFHLVIPRTQAAQSPFFTPFYLNIYDE